MEKGHNIYIIISLPSTFYNNLCNACTSVTCLALNIPARNRIKHSRSCKAHADPIEINAFQTHWKLVDQIKVEIIRFDFAIFQLENVHSEKLHKCFH